MILIRPSPGHFSVFCVLMRTAMRFDTYSQDVLRELSRSPGGCVLAAALVEKLDIGKNDSVLDLRPGYGTLASIVAREFTVQISALTSDPASSETVCDRFRKMDADGRLQVVVGTTSSVPVEPDTYRSIYCLGNPFLPNPMTIHARELYRVLKPEGRVVLAGPVSITNETPAYMEDVIESCGDTKVRTPAYTALLYAREGFHITSAEYFPDAWDLLLQWIMDNSSDVIPEPLHRAIIEDGGRWLSLGTIVLRKPSKPEWAI